MRFTIATLGLAALAVANPAPQGVTSAIAPTASPPASCSENYSGSFQIQVVNVTRSKRELVERQDTVLTIKLANGVLTDAKGRTGYIAANYQFQFDAPPQTGAIYTAGWSVCSNTSLALGGSTIFYQCLSGTFYNLYDQSTGAQCSPVYIEAIAVSPSGAASQISDGQITASAVASQLTDGQVTASAVKSPLSQSSDGQIEVTTGKPATSAAPVTQISDGQIQATTATAKPVTQITDGQPQVPTATATAKPVTQITDGQPQAPTVKPVTQISDGQPQVPTGRSNSTITAAAPSTAVSPYTGAAMTAGVRGEIFGLAAGVLAVALL